MRCAPVRRPLSEDRSRPDEDTTGGFPHGERLGRARPAEVPALAVVDAQRLQRRGVLRRLHALGDHCRAGAVREGDQRADQRGEHLVGGHAGGDAPVELDDVRGGHHDVPQAGEAGADVVDGQPQPSGAERGQGGEQDLVVLDLVVLGELEDDAVQRQPAQQLGAPGDEHGGGGDVHRHVAVDPVQELGGALEGLQLQGVSHADAVRLGEDDVGGAAPPGGEAGQRLGAHAGAGGQVDDGLQQDDRAAVGDERVEAALDLGAPLLVADLGLDDDGRRGGEHLHQRQIALAELLVRPEAERAEGAVEAAVGQPHRGGDVAADARDARRGQRHRQREPLHVGDDGGQPAVEDGLAEGRVLAHLGALLDQDRHRGLDHLQVLGGAVHAAEEGDTQVQRLLGGHQQVGDLLVGRRTLPAHEHPLSSRRTSAAPDVSCSGPTRRGKDGGTAVVAQDDTS